MPFFLKSNVNMGSARLLFLELQGCLICPYLETLFNLFVYFSFRKSTIRRITADAPCQGVCKCFFFALCHLTRFLCLHSCLPVVHLEPCSTYRFFRRAFSLGPTMSCTPHLGVFINSVVLESSSPVGGKPAKI